MPTTSNLTEHVTEHSVVVDAPRETVFDLIADVSTWPQIFGPTIHVELLDDRSDEQLMQIWAQANGQVRTWTSRRQLDRRESTIRFAQVVPAPPVAAMRGQWQVLPAADGRCLVLLRHEFRAVDDDRAAAELIRTAVDRNSDAELAALRAAADPAETPAGLRFTFSDSVRVDAGTGDVFQFLARAGDWPQHLPHVARVALTEPEPGVQQLEMDTRAPDGTTHTTVSVRVCFPDRGLIVYKQLRLPPVLASHTGRWELASDGAGVRATSWHTVTLCPAGVRRVLGPAATLGAARDRVRQALGTNSSTTLRQAKAYAESCDHR